jgi:hypothetical protein
MIGLEASIASSLNEPASGFPRVRIARHAQLASTPHRDLQGHY